MPSLSIYIFIKFIKSIFKFLLFFFFDFHLRKGTRSKNKDGKLKHNLKEFLKQVPFRINSMQ